MPRIRPYSRPPALANLDHRTREARFMAVRRKELIAHCGGSPSQTQKVMIERAVWLSLRIALLDRKQAEMGEMTEHDSRTYLAWVGSLTRLMEDLGPAVPSPTAKVPTMSEYLASRAAQAHA